MEISDEEILQIINAFNLNTLQRIPFSFKHAHSPVSVNDFGKYLYKDPIWTSDFQKSSGTKYICGIANEHIHLIAQSCSCTGEYGMLIHTSRGTPPLSLGHMINLNLEKNYLKKAYDSKEEFIKENKSPVVQDEFSNHTMKLSNCTFNADIVYSAIFKIIHPELFSHYVEQQQRFRHIENSEPVKIINNLFAQDTYVKLIF